MVQEPLDGHKVVLALLHLRRPSLMHSDVFRLLTSSLSSPLVKVEIVLLCAARKREDGVGWGKTAFATPRGFWSTRPLFPLFVLFHQFKK